jgi:hypothetical protein
MTQFFMKAVFEGASLGRAALTARQKYVQQASELDPVDLKTLAQFNLLGDPSVHPVRSRKPTGVPRGMAQADAERQQRQERRGRMKQLGAFLDASKATASQKEVSTTRGGAKRPANVVQALQNIAREAGFDPGRAFSAYAVALPPGARAAGSGTRGAASKAAGGPATAMRYYVAISRRPKLASGGAGLRVAAVAKEVGGRIVGFRIYTEK